MNLIFAQALLPGINLWLIAPELIVCTAAVVVMMVDAFSRPSQRWITGGISLAGYLVQRRAQSGFGRHGPRPRLLTA